MITLIIVGTILFVYMVIFCSLMVLASDFQRIVNEEAEKKEKST